MPPRKIILDVDPGIDDAVAVTLALADPRLDVVAVTAVAGNVAADQATRNVQAIVEQLDPPKWPRIGAAVEPDRAPAVDARHVFGADGLGNSSFQVAELHNRHASVKVLCDEIRAAPGQVTVVALGPLTNIARALQRDPGVAELLGRLVIMGGTHAGPGNVTPAAEFNFYCDPTAARAVLRAPLTKSLIPLDVTTQVVMNYDLLDQLPGEGTKAGRFLRRILPFAFRSHRQLFGLEGIHLHDAVALAAVTHPELFTTELAAADVETLGDITNGAVVFDRRPRREWGTNVDVALEVDAVAVKDYILRGLSEAAGLG